LCYDIFLPTSITSHHNVLLYQFRQVIYICLFSPGNIFNQNLQEKHKPFLQNLNFKWISMKNVEMFNSFQGKVLIQQDSISIFRQKNAAQQIHLKTYPTGNFNPTTNTSSICSPSPFQL
jgi:hypothetical protein